MTLPLEPSGARMASRARSTVSGKESTNVLASSLRVYAPLTTAPRITSITSAAPASVGTRRRSSHITIGARAALTSAASTTGMRSVLAARRKNSTATVARIHCAVVVADELFDRDDIRAARFQNRAGH